MVTVILLGELGRRFGRRHSLAIASAAEAIRALTANFPAFERELVASGERGVGYRVLAGRDALALDRLHEPTGTQHITIAPVLTGAGGDGLGQILLGAALLAVAWWNHGGHCSPCGSRDHHRLHRRPRKHHRHPCDRLLHLDCSGVLTKRITMQNFTDIPIEPVTS